MTTKRHSKSKPKKERPKLKKETLRDLNPKGMAGGVRGGRGPESGRTGCIENEGGTHAGCGS